MNVLPALSPQASPAHRSRRMCSTTSEQWPLAARLNRTLEEYPFPSFVLYLGSSFGTFGMACLALQVLHFDAPALAVAGIVSKLTKKLRTPVDFSLAAMLSHAVPVSKPLAHLLSAHLSRAHS